MEEQRKWPFIYYASDKDLSNPKMYKCNPKQARKRGVLGMRTWKSKFDKSLTLASYNKLYRE